MLALEPRCTHPQGQSNPESLSSNRLCKHNRSWGDSPSIASQTGTAFPAPKQGPFPASLTAQTARGCFGTTNAGTPGQVVPKTETKPWFSQLSSAPLNPMTPIPSQKNVVAMDACFLLLALEEGPPLSARLRGGDGVGDIFPITSPAVKLCTSPSRRRNRPQLSQTNSVREAETAERNAARGLLCAREPTVCTPRGTPSPGRGSPPARGSLETRNPDTPEEPALPRACAGDSRGRQGTGGRDRETWREGTEGTTTLS